MYSKYENQHVNNLFYLYIYFNIICLGLSFLWDCTFQDCFEANKVIQFITRAFY